MSKARVFREPEAVKRKKKRPKLGDSQLLGDPFFFYPSLATSAHIHIDTYSSFKNNF